MDSLTQIVLGAATGEVVLGKKIGNRAMLWGAVGGTIPDLDVLGKYFLSNIDKLVFHRGISHSILFSILGAFVIGWLVHQIYKSPYHKWIALVFKALAFILIGFATDFVLKIFLPNNYIPIILVSIGLLYLWYSNIRKNYFKNNWKAPEASLRNWQWLFFWSLFTHPILDCFTMYGTQLFAPFSNIRISWSTISVVDPIYTTPFLICLLIATRFARTSKKRRYWNYLGIALSSFYLLFTVINKQRANQVFTEAFQKQNIPVERFISNATILNNVLWSCTAETKDHYYLAQYSFFDEIDVRFIELEKNHELLEGLNSDPTVQTLRWFCDDYFNVLQVGDKFQFNDLRFGTFKGEANNADDFIFKFYLTRNSKGKYDMEEAVGGPPPEEDNQNLLKELWDRIMGIKA